MDSIQQPSKSTSVPSLDEVIEKLQNQNENFRNNHEAFELYNIEKNKSFEELQKVYESKHEANLRSLEMMRQRQSLGEQKIHEIEFLVELLRMRVRQMGIEAEEEEESDSGSDEVFDESESESEE